MNSWLVPSSRGVDKQARQISQQFTIVLNMFSLIQMTEIRGKDSCVLGLRDLLPTTSDSRGLHHHKILMECGWNADMNFCSHHD